MKTQHERHEPDDRHDYGPLWRNKTVPQLVCQWHGCKMFAVTEVKRGVSQPFVCLCAKHRNNWEVIGDRALEAMRWPPRRRKVIGG